MNHHYFYLSFLANFINLFCYAVIFYSYDLFYSCLLFNDCDGGISTMNNDRKK